MVKKIKITKENYSSIWTEVSEGKSMRDIICNSADETLEVYIRSLQTDTSFHRMKKQESKCGYGLAGVCCRLCSNGPCRLSPSKPKGVCGADSDTIVVRNFLRSVAAGSGCYIHVIENTAKRLKELALSDKEIKGKNALEYVCNKLGVVGDTCNQKALLIAELVLDDLRKPIDEKMKLVSQLTIQDRVNVWGKLGIMPGGSKDEVFNAVIKTSTNLSSDPIDMLMQCLRLGISTGIYGLVLTNLLNDIIIGEPEITYESVGLRVIDPECINIMLTGHQQSMFGDLIEKLNSVEISMLAKTVGAKGIKIVGCTCVGQDFQVRSNVCGNAFCGHAGNNYTSEAVLSTGCIDMVVSEFNCSIPGIEPICEELKIAMICLDDVAKKKNAKLISYTDKEKEEISIQIIAGAIESYKNRRNVIQLNEIIKKCECDISNPLYNMLCDGEQRSNVENAIKLEIAGNTRENPMVAHGNEETIAGVTDMTLRNVLGGSYQPLIDLIISGKIKGIAAVVGCSNLRAKGHDVFTVELTKKLISKNILVLSAGCTCGGLENCGLMSKEAAELAGPGLKEVCKQLDIPPVLNFGPCLAIGRIEMVASEIAAILDVDIPKLPVVVSAPQWLEEQALADGAFALAMGFPLHLGLAPFVTGSEIAIDILTDKLKDLTGGYLFVETDIELAANRIIEIIEKKRQGLKI